MSDKEECIRKGMILNRIEVDLDEIAAEFSTLNANLEDLIKKLDKVLELNAETVLKSLWNTIEKIVEEDHP